MNEELKNKYKKKYIRKNIKNLLKIIDDPNIKIQNDKKKIIKHFPSFISSIIENDQYIAITNDKKKSISYLFHDNYVSSYKSFSILDETLSSHLDFIKEKLNEQLNRIQKDILYDIHIVKDITNNQEKYFTPTNHQTHNKYDTVYLINIKPKFVAIFEYGYDRKICNSYIITLKKITKKDPNIKKGGKISYINENNLNLFFWYEKNNLKYPKINDFNLTKNINKDNLLIIANNYNNLVKYNKIDEKEPEIKINNEHSLFINRLIKEIQVHADGVLIETIQMNDLTNNKTIKYLENYKLI